MTTELLPLNRQTAAAPLLYPERVVQFGGGNFLRGFVDWIVQQLNQQTNFASSVVVIKPTASGDYDQWKVQEGLFHVRLHGLENDQLVTSSELITCVSRAINPYQDHQAYLALARQPELRFVISNTTEMGLSYADADQLNDAPPSSFPAKLTQFLYQRYAHFDGAADKGCILLPTELVEQNGSRLQQLVLQYAEQWALEAGFKHWIEANNLFCNTLVDRIVTGFPKQNSAAVLAQLGYDDQLLVEAERYHQWIIEAPPILAEEFPVAQTSLNIQIVADAEPYRQIKVRILNGAHTTMVPLGYFMGLETVRQVVEHDWLGAFIHAAIYEEILPAFGRDDPQLAAFAEAGLNRFRNPFIQHRLLSIALNSVSKFKVRVLPSLLGYQLQRQQLPERLVFAFAALIRFYKGEWRGAAIPLNDDPSVVAWFRKQWQTADIAMLVENVLANQTLWDRDLRDVVGLSELLIGYLTRLETVNDVLLTAEDAAAGELLAEAFSQA